jgi:glycosyltransferase involved in cell wall biosynthesis
MASRHNASETADPGARRAPARPPGRTILQVYHTLAVGGVASYLLNLSVELQRRGHRVVVAAPPGELTPQFERRGVRCVPVRISDWHLLRARRELSEVIRREGADLVHAHDYSAGAAAFLGARRTGTPYLLSIHCPRPRWQRLVVFYWSPKVVAMSPELRDHLTRDLGLPSGRVLESFVGVDVEHFAPGPPPDGLIDALGLRAADPVIVHVSRLSTMKSPVALALIEATVRLGREHPGLVVLLAGAGEALDRVRAAAGPANDALGRPAVRVLGTRRDVADLLRLATVAVGTGSVALEALASGCPVVAAGRFGCGGLVTPENFAAAWAHLFGDHGRWADAAAGMAEAIAGVLHDPQRRARLAAWGRAVVVEQFSRQRMAEHIEGVYTELARAG